MSAQYYYSLTKYKLGSTQYYKPHPQLKKKRYSLDSERFNTHLKSVYSWGPRKQCIPLESTRLDTRMILLEKQLVASLGLRQKISKNLPLNLMQAMVVPSTSIPVHHSVILESYSISGNILVHRWHNLCWDMPWLGRLFPGLWSQRPWLNTRQFHVGYVVDILTLRQGLLREIRYSPVSDVPLVIHSHISSIYHPSYIILAMDSVVK